MRSAHDQGYVFIPFPQVYTLFEGDVMEIHLLRSGKASYQEVGKPRLPLCSMGCYLYLSDFVVGFCLLKSYIYGVRDNTFYSNLYFYINKDKFIDKFIH